MELSWKCQLQARVSMEVEDRTLRKSSQAASVGVEQWLQEHFSQAEEAPEVQVPQKREVEAAWEAEAMVLLAKSG